MKELKKGVLKKKNEFYMQQTRTFILTNEPKLRYYKNETEYRVSNFTCLHQFREKFHYRGKLTQGVLEETDLK